MSRALLIEALAQALRREAAGGLIAADRPSLLRRLSFLLRSMNDDRIHDVGRYLTTRVRGGATPAGGRRTGQYSGAYVRPAQDVLDERLFGLGLGLAPAVSLREALSERISPALST